MTLKRDPYRFIKAYSLNTKIWKMCSSNFFTFHLSLLLHTYMAFRVWVRWKFRICLNKWTCSIIRICSNKLLCIDLSARELPPIISHSIWSKDSGLVWLNRRKSWTYFSDAEKVEFSYTVEWMSKIKSSIERRNKILKLKYLRFERAFYRDTLKIIKGKNIFVQYYQISYFSDVNLKSFS